MSIEAPIISLHTVDKLQAVVPDIFRIQSFPLQHNYVINIIFSDTFYMVTERLSIQMGTSIRCMTFKIKTQGNSVPFI